ncbi:hypothetical protein RN001_006630 [Aquatica leii]|uniref:Uncharacterized protein n=1 Tax=Aquatica leii TaxID=1421715 RepID=A0AAN7PLB8_9COLE|nr:hypothetical protein RN001_006630 [Aquatica leii]
MRLDLLLPAEQKKSQYWRKEEGSAYRKRLPRNCAGVTKRNVKFHEGENVYVRDYRRSKPSWVPVKIIKQNGSRNYKTITNENLIWRRLSDQIIKGPSYDYDDELDDLIPPLIVDPNDIIVNNDDRLEVVGKSATEFSSKEPIWEAETIADAPSTSHDCATRPIRNRKPPDWFRPTDSI